MALLSTTGIWLCELLLGANANGGAEDMNCRRFNKTWTMTVLFKVFAKVLDPTCFWM